MSRTPYLVAGGVLLFGLGGLGACGEILDAPVYLDTFDASADSPSGADALDVDAPSSVTPATCDRTKPFEPPVRVKGIPKGVSCMRLSEDEELAFYSVGTTSYVATRVDDGFVTASALAMTGEGSCPTLSADRTILFHERQLAVWRQTGKAGGPYGKLAQVQPVSSDGGLITTGNLAFPFFDEPRHQLFVTIAESTYQRLDLAVAPVTDAGDVGAFQTITVTGPRELFPVVSADGLSLYFASAGGTVDAGDLDTTKNADVHVVTRPNTTARFGSTSTAVPNVNSDKRDYPTWVSPDDCRLYIASARGSATGSAQDLEVFVASRGN